MDLYGDSKALFLPETKGTISHPLGIRHVYDCLCLLGCEMVPWSLAKTGPKPHLSLALITNLDKEIQYVGVYLHGGEDVLSGPYLSLLVASHHHLWLQ